MPYHFFFDFDSTIVTQESLDEVIKLSLNNHPDKEALIQKIENITNASMGGDLDFTESLTKRLNIVNISKQNFEIVAQNLTKKITPGIEDLFEIIRQKNHQINIISGGFLELIEPTAKMLNIRKENCFANAVRWDKHDLLESIDLSNPLTKSNGKSILIPQLKKTGKIIMIGDGSNDLNVFKDHACDTFIGFGINVVRENVKKESPLFFEDISELSNFFEENFPNNS